MQEISEDMQSAVPQLHLDAMEGDNINLTIYFLQNGPSNTDYTIFTITTGGTANGMFFNNDPTLCLHNTWQYM